MRSFISVTMFLSFTLLLSGCYYGAPSPMPRGGSSYNQELKSVDGAKVRQIGYDYSIDNNKAALDELLPIAQELAEMLNEKLPSGMDKIYLNIPANTAFYNSFDYLLRGELRQLGYVLVNSSDSSDSSDATRVDFVAKITPAECEHNNSYLALAINVIDNVPSDIVGGLYNVPLYGYRRAGFVKIDMPLCASK